MKTLSLICSLSRFKHNTLSLDCPLNMQLCMLTKVLRVLEATTAWSKPMKTQLVKMIS